MRINYEYKTIEYFMNGEVNRIGESLDWYGKSGWDLVKVLPQGPNQYRCVVFLKRELVSE